MNLVDEIIEAIGKAEFKVEAVLVTQSAYDNLCLDLRLPYLNGQTILGIPVIRIVGVKDGPVPLRWALQPRAKGADVWPTWPPPLRPHDMTLCPQCDRLVQTELYAHHFHDHAVLKEKTK